MKAIRHTPKGRRQILIFRFSVALHSSEQRKQPRSEAKGYSRGGAGETQRVRGFARYSSGLGVERSLPSTCAIACSNAVSLWRILTLPCPIIAASSSGETTQ